MDSRPQAQPEGDIFEHGQMAEQGVVLEDEAHLALARGRVGGVLVVEADGAAVGHFEAGDDAQQRGLSRTRWPEQRHQLARFDAQADIVQRFERAEVLADVPDFDAHFAPSLVFHSRTFLSARVMTAITLSSDATANAPE